MVLLHAWQRDERGGLRRGTFDHRAIPAGWYDAPDKVPAVEVPAWAEQTFSARVPDPTAISPERAAAPVPTPAPDEALGPAPDPAPDPAAMPVPAAEAPARAPRRAPARRRAGRARKR
ncbi:MAG: hypothetical protein U1E53_13065 [Dongiaceae bacterium]